MKQVQDAYIVAATRTPIGRSHRGFLQATLRPDDLLAHCIAGSAWRRCPGLDPKAIEDVICRLRHPGGAAGPERGAHRRDPGRAAQLAWGALRSTASVPRACRLWQMAADRIRVGEAEVMVAAGTESMSMVPMMGNSAEPVAHHLPPTPTTSSGTASPTVWA